MWREANKRLTLSLRPSTRKGRLHKIGRLGRGMGHSSIPHALYGWDGVLNTQTTYNGGGMRPRLSCTDYTDIDCLRKTTPLEACRAASLDDSYYSYATSFNDDDSFVFQCANAGIPLMTCRALDEAIMLHLKECGVEPSTPRELSRIQRVSKRARKVIRA